MDTRYTYQASASWSLHHRGNVSGENIPVTLEFAVPPEFGGEPGFWTPEHMLLAAVASCYVATFRGMAEKSKLEFGGIETTVEGVIERQDGVLRFTRITIHPTVTVLDEANLPLASRLMDKAERGCLIMRSLTSESVLQAKVLVESVVGV